MTSEQQHEDTRARVTFLEERQRDLQTEFSAMRNDIIGVRIELAHLIAGARVLRWIIGVGLPGGPALGVVLTKLWTG